MAGRFKAGDEVLDIGPVARGQEPTPFRIVAREPRRGYVVEFRDHPEWHWAPIVHDGADLVADTPEARGEAATHIVEMQAAALANRPIRRARLAQISREIQAEMTGHKARIEALERERRELTYEEERVDPEGLVKSKAEDAARLAWMRSQNEEFDAQHKH